MLKCLNESNSYEEERDDFKEKSFLQRLIMNNKTLNKYDYSQNLSNSFRRDNRNDISNESIEKIYRMISREEVDKKQHSESKTENDYMIQKQRNSILENSFSANKNTINENAYGSIRQGSIFHTVYEQRQ